MDKYRELVDHKINECNDELDVLALDGPGQGGASHLYSIVHDENLSVEVYFQNGPIGEVGVNGVTNEAILAILIDRMKGFQSGAFSCRENALVLTKLQEAMHWLQHRTRDRLRRGVEGTNER